jgi:arabinose-5-phosphate isomerase
MLSKEDIVIAISFSGESEEVTRLIPNIKAIGAKLIAISGNANSTLVKHSDIYQLFPEFNEACLLKLAPTSSTTAALVYGDALAVVASLKYGFTEKNYGLFHPAGSLGKKLFIKVKDVMSSGNENAIIYKGDTLKNAIVELGNKGLGIITVVDHNKIILGVLTDGDLRRQLEKGVDIYKLRIDDVLTKKPIVISQELLAVEALKILKDKNISSAPVWDENKTVVGTIRLQDILNQGII